MRSRCSGVSRLPKEFSLKVIFSQNTNSELQAGRMLARQAI